MMVLPVLDILGGLVVRGIAGRRSAYRPIRSSLTNSADPRRVACAFRDHFALSTLYVADLDAIAGKAPAIDLYTALHDLGFALAVDAGLGSAADAHSILAAGVQTVVAGLETVDGPGALRELVRQAGAARLLFSLDLKDGQPLAASAGWRAQEPWDIITHALQAGVRRILVLDLARVGIGSGTGTESLCARLTATYPQVEVLAGGGVRDRGDLDRLRSVGISGVLVASALHDGRLRREDLAS